MEHAYSRAAPRTKVVILLIKLSNYIILIKTLFCIGDKVHVLLLAPP
jgi:hypothetical protein